MISTNEILSINLQKFNSVFCWFDQESKKSEFRMIPSPLDQIRQAVLLKPDSPVLVEACFQGNQILIGVEKPRTNPWG